jgi:hypothetical protein
VASNICWKYRRVWPRLLEANMPADRTYWFSAKRYGWGLPLTWQGWVTLAVFLTLVVGGTVVVPPPHGLVVFIAYVCGLSIARCHLLAQRRAAALAMREDDGAR